MGAQPTKSLQELAVKEGPYPEEAYHFVRDGLSFAVDQVHGPATREVLAVSKYLAEQEIDLAELYFRLEEGRLSSDLMRAVEAAGGYEKLNRHISGQELCWGLRDLALKQWGLMATTVLKSWNLSETVDFGLIVFALIKHGFMKKEAHDQLKDFRDVYDFEETMTKSFCIGKE